MWFGRLSAAQTTSKTHDTLRIADGLVILGEQNERAGRIKPNLMEDDILNAKRVIIALLVLILLGGIITALVRASGGLSLSLPDVQMALGYLLSSAVA